MEFKGISLRGPKRAFYVESINNGKSGIGKYHEKCFVQIRNPNTVSTPQPDVGRKRLQVVGISGIDQAILKLNRFLGNFDREFKFKWPRRSCAILLHGGHGSGKTFIINQIIDSGWTKNIFRIDIDAKPSTIKTTFKNAILTQPSIIVIDELESIVSKDDPASQKLANLIGDELDNLSQNSSSHLPQVLVLTATLNASNIPLSLKKRGRLRNEILLPIPDAAARKCILKSLNPPLPPEIYVEVLEKLGDRTHAYTAEDLACLLDTACEIAEEITKKIESSVTEKPFYLSSDDLEKALQLVRPTAMHDISLKPPSVRWHEIGGQESTKKALRRAVETPLMVSYLVAFQVNFT